MTQRQQGRLGRYLPARGAIPALALLLLSGAAWAAPAKSGQPQAATAAQPVAPLRPVTAHYGALEVVDDYRWLETPGGEAAQYLQAQTAFADRTLQKLRGAERLRQTIAAVTAPAPEITQVKEDGDALYYLTRDPGAAAARLMLRGADGGTPVLLADPAHEGGGFIGGFAPSQDGNFVAYTLAPQPGRPDAPATLHILDTRRKTALSETLPALGDAGIAWQRSGEGFYYTRPEDPAAAASPRAIYLHKLGTPAERDTSILSAAHLPMPFPAAHPVPRLIIPAASDYALLTLATAAGQDMAVYAVPETQLSLQPAPWQSVAGAADGVVAVAPSVSLVFLLTHAGAPNRRVVAEDLAEPGFANGRTLIPAADGAITAIATASDALFVARRSGAGGKLLRLDFNESVPQEVPLPADGVVAADGGLAADPRSPGAVFSLRGWLQPQAWLRYDFKRHRAVELGVAPGPGGGRYTSAEVAVPAADGSSVPLTLIMRQDTARDHARPTVLLAGAPDGQSGAHFLPAALAWADQGGVFAIAQPRGSAAGNAAWRAAGSGVHRGVAYGDVAACAAWLQAAGYTDAAHLAAWGEGATAPVVAGGVLRAPARFAALALTGGILDPLHSTGPGVAAEFGNVAVKAEAPLVVADDPLAQIKDGTEYPASLIQPGAAAGETAAPAWESLKFAARLQAASVSGKPVLLHDAGLPAETQMAFLLWQLGVPGFDLAKAPPAPAHAARRKHR